MNTRDELPIQIDVLGIVATLPFHHKDPFDRVIIAQAIHHQMPLISVDALFDDYPIQKVW